MGGGKWEEGNGGVGGGIWEDTTWTHSRSQTWETDDMMSVNSNYLYLRPLFWLNAEIQSLI